MQPKTLLRISRPRFWIYLLGPFLTGLAANGFFESIFPLIIFGAYFTFPANLLIYGVNDIFDYQTDLLNDKKQGYESFVRPADRKALWTAIALTNLPFLIPFVIAGAFWPYSIIGILGFLFFGIFYSAPPIRAKARPFFDSIFNILYLLPGLFGYLIYNSPAYVDISLLIAAGFWCMAMHAYSAVPDIQADRGANLRTIATLLGRNRTLWLCLCLYGSAAVLSVHALGMLAYTLGIIYVGLMALSMKTRSDHELFRYYTWFPRINTVAGFALFIFALMYRV
jgi:4-hydroxybenzoate polyprenyltransferase